ncbi:uncharacterized protein BDV14DRAFT_86104 [Aspergillus stella-maris]|uniref:uncharacterized protein n=1 Tax=Aspergillus stella-maris TaxID=1810926 RepID=UPI003CCDFDCD
MRLPWPSHKLTSRASFPLYSGIAIAARQSSRRLSATACCTVCYPRLLLIINPAYRRVRGPREAALRHLLTSSLPSVTGAQVVLFVIFSLVVPVPRLPSPSNFFRRLR